MDSEVGYHEYSKQYAFMNSDLENYTVFAAEFNIQKQEFFGFKYDFKIDFMNQTRNHYTHYIDKNGTTRQVFTGTEVISNLTLFKKIISTQKSCVVLKPFSRSLILGEEAYEIILSEMKLKKQFVSFETYCN